jgi:hypothetical protein
MISRGRMAHDQESSTYIRDIPPLRSRSCSLERSQCQACKRDKIPRLNSLGRVNTVYQDLAPNLFECSQDAQCQCTFAMPSDVDSSSSERVSKACPQARYALTFGRQPPLAQQAGLRSSHHARSLADRDHKRLRGSLLVDGLKAAMMTAPASGNRSPLLMEIASLRRMLSRRREEENDKARLHSSKRSTVTRAVSMLPTCMIRS